MAHQITEADSMFSVRKPTWHGLGATLPEYPTREDAQRLAHPWEPIEEPVYLRHLEMVDYGMPGDYSPQPSMTYKEAPDFKAIRRSDNGSLLGIVGDGYHPVKNNEMWDIAEALQQGASDVMFETAGSLQGGKKVWILVKLADPIHIDGDPNGATIPYFALQNSHNGSGAFRGQATMTRIVCANTAQIADQDAKARGTQFSFRHTLNVGERIEEARAALTGWRHSIEQWRLMTEHMLTLKVDVDGVMNFLERWIPLPPEHAVSERVVRNVHEARSQWLECYKSATCEGITGTAHGLTQASIEYAEHIRKAQSEESRFRRSYLDRSEVVQTAQRLALEVAR